MDSVVASLIGLLDYGSNAEALVEVTEVSGDSQPVLALITKAPAHKCAAETFMMIRSTQYWKVQGVEATAPTAAGETAAELSISKLTMLL